MCICFIIFSELKPFTGNFVTLQDSAPSLASGGGGGGVGGSAPNTKGLPANEKQNSLTYLREESTVVVADIVVFGIICFIALYCDSDLERYLRSQRRAWCFYCIAGPGRTRGRSLSCAGMSAGRWLS